MVVLTRATLRRMGGKRLRKRGSLVMISSGCSRAGGKRILHLITSSMA